MTISADRIGVIVLAAGASRRFQGDKRIAMLATGKSILETSLNNVPDSITRRLLVLKPQDERLAEQFHEHWQIVFADSAHTGMGASLAASIEHVKTWHGALIALGDMPYIKKETYLTLQTELCKHPIVVPTVSNFRKNNDPSTVNNNARKTQRGHPVGFQQRFFQEIAALSEDKGAKLVMQEHANLCVETPVTDPGILLDIDTKDELER